jgi:hypothetical protein
MDRRRVGRVIPSRLDLLELDLDTRLHNLWAELADFDERLSHEQVATFIRCAYGEGYRDALTEDVPGSLYRDNGYRVPGRRV